MLRIAFWNVHNNTQCAALLAALCDVHDVAIAFVAEYGSDAQRFSRAFNDASPCRFESITNNCERVVTLSRLSQPSHIVTILDTRYFTTVRVTAPAMESILATGVHLPSALYADEATREYECIDLARQLAAVEDREGHARSVVIGDFNLDPYHNGLVAHGAMHAISSRAIAAKQSRVHLERQSLFYYNPMWSHLGDYVGSSHGTYYYRGSGVRVPYWHAYDQALLRPSLSKHFVVGDLQVISDIDGVKLVDQHGVPDIENVSDHLPIVLNVRPLL